MDNLVDVPICLVVSELLGLSSEASLPSRTQTNSIQSRRYFL